MKMFKHLILLSLCVATGLTAPSEVKWGFWSNFFCQFFLSLSLSSKTPSPAVQYATGGLPPRKNPILPLFNHTDFAELPLHYDCEEYYPQCLTIKNVRNQGACGSCWAFATSSVISDRICIYTKSNVHISAEDLLECSTTNGCNGGYPEEAFAWYVSNGVVTGGPYNSNEGCKPYLFPSINPTRSSRNSPYPPTPQCTQYCESGYPVSYAQDKYFGSSAYRLQGEQQMMQNIWQYGPITVMFQVYQDFQTYNSTSGVYWHQTGEYVSPHVVKLIGWGQDSSGVKYWLGVNSWGERWGIGGLFKFWRGSNHLGIESQAASAIPRV